jgi:putative ABC transport system permease protein
VFTIEEVNSISRVALISEEFARLNQLSVGSTMLFRNIEFNPEAMNMGRTMTDEDVFLNESYDIEVVGIFRIISYPTHDDPWINMFMSREMYNRIYIPNSFAIMTSRIQNVAMREFHPEFFNTVAGLREGEDYIWWENFFTLFDPNEFPQFREAVAAIMPPYFEVLDTGGSLQPILLALDTMKGFAFTVLKVAIGAASVILTLLITLFLRARKKELGIYMTLGEKRSKIISQLLIEVMSIAFLSIMVSLFIGNVFANSVSENMLMNDIAAEQEHASGTGGRLWDFDYFANMGFDTEIPVYIIEASYDVSLSFSAVLIFLGIGLGTVLLATVVPVIYILRLNPKEIML